MTETAEALDKAAWLKAIRIIGYDPDQILGRPALFTLTVADSNPTRPVYAPCTIVGLVIGTGDRLAWVVEKKNGTLETIPASLVTIACRLVDKPKKR